MMEAQLVTYSLAITVATGLLFGVGRMIDSLEKRLSQLHDALQAQHAGRNHLSATEIITLFRQLLYLEKRQSRIEWMGRLLGFGYVTGYVFGVGGLLMLLLCATFDWSESTTSILTAIVSYLALASIVGNLSVMLGVSQAYRRGIKAARIATPDDTIITSP